MHYTCIACITIDSVQRIDKKIIHKFIQKNANIGQKIQMSRFINTDLKSDSESSDLDSEVESKSDAQLMTKLKSDFDQQLFTHTLFKKNLKIQYT